MSRLFTISAALFLLAAAFNLKIDAQVSISTDTHSGTDTLVRLTDVPRILSYQGQLTTTSGNPMNGTHKITATLYTDHLGRNAIWQGSYNAEITGGIFTVMLGSGAQKLPDNSAMNQPLWVGIRVDESEEMKPLTQLASVPYALNVPDRSITMAKLAPEVVLEMGKTPTPQHDPDDWALAGNSGLGTSGGFLGTNDTASVQIRVDNGGSSSSSGRVITFGQGNNITGGHYSNSIVSGLSCVIGGGGYRIGSTNHPNTIGVYAASYYCFLGGGADNLLTAIGGFIGGGVGDSLLGEYSTITGGQGNRIGDFSATPPSGDMTYSFIGGGHTNTVNAHYSSVVGGSSNTVGGNFSVILGGQGLTLNTSNSFGFRSGANGIGDLVNVDLWLANDDGTARKFKFFDNSGKYTSFKAGAQSSNIEFILPNTIGSATQALSIAGVTGDTATLTWGPSGANAWNITGNSNTDPSSGKFLGTNNNKAFEIHVNDSGAANQGDKRVMRFEPNAKSANIIGGYQGNLIPSKGFGNVIGGGGANLDANGNSDINKINSNSDSTRINTFGFIGGGDRNTILEDQDGLPDEPVEYGNVIVGGRHNTVSDVAGFIGGGEDNIIQEGHSVIVGGIGNISNGDFSSMVGGDSNTVDGDARHTFIGGGHGNRVQTDFSVVVGGLGNLASNTGSFVGGGGKLNNPNKATGLFSVVVGGFNNVASGNNAFAGGGDSNIAQGSSSFVGGGLLNRSNGIQSAVVGGFTNHADQFFSFIGGGSNNSISNGNAVNANIPGGDHLTAQSYAQTVIGYFDSAQGTSNPVTINPNDRVFIIGNGTAATHRNAYEVSNNGHSIVFDTLGRTSLISTTPSIKGARYIDNTPIAWGRMTSAGVITEGFGIDAANCAEVPPGSGKYRIVINYIDPYNTSNQITLPHGSSIVATIETTEDDYHCSYINTTAMTTYTPGGGVAHAAFFVRICKTGIANGILTCVFDRQPFSFAVFARP